MKHQWVIVCGFLLVKDDFYNLIIKNKGNDIAVNSNNKKINTCNIYEKNN